MAFQDQQVDGILTSEMEVLFGNYQGEDIYQSAFQLSYELCIVTEKLRLQRQVLN